MQTTIEPSHAIQPPTELRSTLFVFAPLVWGMALGCALLLRGNVDFAALDGSPTWVWGMLLLISWIPAIAAIATQLFRTGTVRGTISGWRIPKLRWTLAAFAIPSVYSTAVAILTWVSGAGTPDLQPFERTATGALGHWSSPHLVALCYAILTIIGGTLAVSAFALGEELGWSGFVIPRLLPQLGVGRTALVTGTLWSSYHVPLVLLAKNYTQNTSICFTIIGLTFALVGLAFVSTWLRIRSNSLWPAVLLHAAHNAWMFLLYEPLTRAKPLTPYVGGEHGAGMVLVAVVLVLSVTRATKS